MGCAMSRESVPPFCSALIASNPRLIPNKGAKKPKKMWKGGRLLSVTVRSLRYTNARSGSCKLDKLPFRLDRETYMDARKVSPTNPIRMIKRQLRICMAVSLWISTCKGVVLWSFWGLLIAFFEKRSLKERERFFMDTAIMCFVLKIFLIDFVKTVVFSVYTNDVTLLVNQEMNNIGGNILFAQDFKLVVL